MVTAQHLIKVLPARPGRTYMHQQQFKMMVGGASFLGVGAAPFV